MKGSLTSFGTELPVTNVPLDYKFLASLPLDNVNSCWVSIMPECISQYSILFTVMPQLFSQKMEWPKDSMGITKWCFLGVSSEEGKRGLSVGFWSECATKLFLVFPTDGCGLLWANYPPSQLNFGSKTSIFLKVETIYFYMKRTSY